MAAPYREVSASASLLPGPCCKTSPADSGQKRPRYITERQVCLNLKKAFEGSTVFFITHRLSTIRSADQILMMDQGSLVEMGSHKELIEQQGRYFALFSQQEVGLD